MKYALIPLLPFAAFIVIGLFGHWIRDRAHWIAVPAVLISLLLSIGTFIDVAQGEPIRMTLYSWISSGSFQVPIGFYIDRLAAAMLLLVTIVSGLVHVYTIGYMRGDAGYARFFSYIALFTFSMLMLIMADNFLQLYVFWEAVGLCSYLLIGHWYERKAASDAAMKAFIVNRVGDFGFGLGVMLVFALFGTLQYEQVFAQAAAHAQETLNLLPFGGAWPVNVLTLLCLLLFAGAVGKSAQVPLHVWLPDAMEGPTPISALIHAATMVTAGVFMVARFAGFFSKDEILIGAWSAGPLGRTLTVVGLLTAFLTAFYSFRLVFVAFWGPSRVDPHVARQVHEPSPTMTMPLIVLAALAIVTGYLGIPGFLSPALPGPMSLPPAHEGPATFAIMALATVMGLGGIALAYVFYVLKRAVPSVIAQQWSSLYAGTLNKCDVDEILEAWFLRLMIEDYNTLLQCTDI